jgi:hypothetical protein
MVETALSYNQADKFKAEFPTILEEVEESSYIASLKKDWDDNGALKIPTNIHGAAIQFLEKYALRILDRYNVKIASPSKACDVLVYVYT